MSQVKTIVQRTTLGFAAALVTLLFPGMGYITYADTGPTQTGPTQPTGADGNTFHYNSETGLWENDLYTWDPVTKNITFKDGSNTYDPTTGHWSTNTWQYDAPTGKYVQVPPPDSNSGPSGNSSLTTAGDPATVDQNSTTNTDVNVDTQASINNTIGSIAGTGDANIYMNNLAGNATSGDANALSNTLNLLQSGMSGGGFGTTFVADLPSQNKDLMLDPSLFVVQPAGGCCSGDANTNINVNTGAQITNDITVGAVSGNATIASNNQVGDATTGEANAMANIINMISSAINAAAGSFLGVVNIHGDMNGDILLPPGVLDALLASNAPTMTLDTSSIENSNLLANITDTQNIDNNVNAFAASGASKVDSNNKAGDATSGQASTKITVLNLTGKQVVGADTLLVFVNVMGNWVGMLLNAPNATAAAYGDGPALPCPCGGDTTLNANTNMGITNNVDVTAISGDATATRNNQAGNATTGNATATVNLANITNSTLSLTGWFGVLFINILGNWTGSFGIDTPAGDPIPEPGKGGGTTANNSNSPAPQVFHLTSTGNGNFHLATYHGATDNSGEVEAVTTESDDQGSPNLNILAKDQKPAKGGLNALQIVAAGLLAGCCLLLVRRFWQDKEAK